MVAVAHEKVWSAQALTATKELTEFAHLATKLLQINTSGFSGTIDIRGSLDGVNFINARYVELTGDGLLSIVDNQLSYAAQTTIKVYMLAEFWPHVQLVMARTAGSLTVDAWGHEASPFLAPDSSAAAATAVWAAAARTLTAFTGQPRTDLVGSDVAIWSAVTRLLTAFTGQPRTDLVGSDAALWSHATRVLTGFAYDALVTRELFDSFAPSSDVEIISGAGVDTFGAWAELVANVGTGKKLIGLTILKTAGAAVNAEIEIGEGAGGAEAAIFRFLAPLAALYYGYREIEMALTNNARLSARIRDTSAGALGSVFVMPEIS